MAESANQVSTKVLIQYVENDEYGQKYEIICTFEGPSMHHLFPFEARIRRKERKGKRKGKRKAQS